MRWVRFALRLPFFILFYLKEVTISTFKVAFEIVRPTYSMQPAVIAVPLDVQQETEILLLVNLITMTPGTLSLDMSDDHKILYVHAMFADDPDAVRRDIKQQLEKRVIRLFA